MMESGQPTSHLASSISFGLTFVLAPEIFVGVVIMSGPDLTISAHDRCPTYMIFYAYDDCHSQLTSDRAHHTHVYVFAWLNLFCIYLWDVALLVTLSECLCLHRSGPFRCVLFILSSLARLAAVLSLSLCWPMLCHSNIPRTFSNVMHIANGDKLKPLPMATFLL